jgi:uncharacterized membrane protein
MLIFINSFLTVIYWLFPLLIIHLCHKYKWIGKIGEVILAYVFGLILGHSGLITPETDLLREILIALTIPIAIPLMLFGTDVKMWFKLAPKTISALVTGLLALIIMVVSGFLIFGGQENDSLAKAGGLFMGLYTGGTPNLAALQFVLNVENEAFLAINAYDMAVGSLYLFFLLLAGKRFFGLFLPSYSLQKNGITNSVDPSTFEEPFWGLQARHRRWPLLRVLLISITIFGLSALAMSLVDENLKMPVLVLSITTLGIAFSFNKKVRNTEKSFELGMYFILVFSMIIASKVNIFNLKILDTNLFFYMSWVVLGTLLLHSLFAAIFRIDGDTLMVCSTALICSPPFVPVVASGIGNRQVLVPGLTVGIIGYAIGNYLGILIYQLLLVL